MFEVLNFDVTYNGCVADCSQSMYNHLATPLIMNDNEISNLIKKMHQK